LNSQAPLPRQGGDTNKGVRDIQNYNIKIDIKETVLEVVDWVNLA
jgi:hypothetical protein